MENYIKIPIDLAVEIHDELVCCRKLREYQRSIYVRHIDKHEGFQAESFKESERNTVLLYSKLDDYIKR